ncbi:hypothetical protein PanWU01x14_073680, partial [Parasponia andersonii]
EGHTHTRLNDSTNVISYEAKKAHQSLQSTCRFFEKVLIQSVLRAQRGNPKIPSITNSLFLTPNTAHPWRNMATPLFLFSAKNALRPSTLTYAPYAHFSLNVNPLAH